jgi:hypothetical protein
LSGEPAVIRAVLDTNALTSGILGLQIEASD